MLVVSKCVSDDTILFSSTWSSEVSFSVVPLSLLKTSKNCEMGPSQIEEPTTTNEPGILELLVCYFKLV